MINPLSSAYKSAKQHPIATVAGLAVVTGLALFALKSGSLRLCCAIPSRQRSCLMVA